MRVQRAKNPQSLTSFEQMHLPWILISEFVKKNEKFKVRIKVGEVNHPMTSEHYLRCIRLYINGEQFECRKLKLDDQSEVSFDISLKKDSLIKAQTECNLHGAWEAEKKIVLYRGNED